MKSLRGGTRNRTHCIKLFEKKTVPSFSLDCCLLCITLFLSTFQSLFGCSSHPNLGKILYLFVAASKVITLRTFVYCLEQKIFGLCHLTVYGWQIFCVKIAILVQPINHVCLILINFGHEQASYELIIFRKQDSKCSRDNLLHLTCRCFRVFFQLV